MLTLFGKFTRKLRIDSGELLKDMAEKLGVTSSYLSAVENGKRNVPQSWISKIADNYEITSDQFRELKEAVEKSRQTNKVDLKGMNSDDKDLMMALARRINGLDDQDKKDIKDILQNKQRGE